MRLQRIPAVLGALLLTFGLNPSLLHAGCGTCEGPVGYSACLLGCPSSDPDCARNNCWSSGGTCGNGSPCGTALSQPVLSSGSLAMLDNVDGAEVILVRFVDADGTVAYRVRCNAAVVQLSYEEAAAQAVRASTRNLTV
jgi:hypothetical protein